MKDKRRALDNKIFYLAIALQSLIGGITVTEQFPFQVFLTTYKLNCEAHAM